MMDSESLAMKGVQSVVGLNSEGDASLHKPGRQNARAGPKPLAEYKRYTLY
jgi:hypothetical protein